MAQECARLGVSDLTMLANILSSDLCHATQLLVNIFGFKRAPFDLSPGEDAPRAVFPSVICCI